MATPNVLLREFNVQVYANGRLELDGLDSFICWLLRRKAKEGLLTFAMKISKFGQRARPAKKKR